MSPSAGGNPASPEPTVWFICSQPNHTAAVRLFCFPYAGGGPATFSQWPLNLPDILEVWAAHPPGRGSRHHEPAYRELMPLVGAYSRAIRPLLDRPFALFGHSLGALVAFELARELQRDDVPRPVILFSCACPAPQLPNPQPPIHALPEGEFLNNLQRLNGTPLELLRQPEVMRLLLPTLRADFEALETYNYDPGPPLSCPIIVFGGLNDPRTDRDSLEDWAVHTSSTFKLQFFPGDHFFLNSARESLLASIAAEVRASPSNNIPGSLDG